MSASFTPAAFEPSSEQPTPSTSHAGDTPQTESAMRAACLSDILPPDRISFTAAAPPGEPASIAAITAGAADPGRRKHFFMTGEKIFSYAAQASLPVSMGMSARKGSSAGATP
ncbi:MAG: hypothetical protein IJA26_01710 [Clostridia bacterium]|nr:hypothetical protein [Clostridia bacterium]